MYRIYTDNEQFNFQVNRFLADYDNNPEMHSLIIDTVQKIHNFDDWFEAWSKLAISAEKNASKTQKSNDYGLASTYYRMADFFLNEKDERKEAIYEGYKKNFYKSVDTSNLIFEDVKYKNGFMPVARINHPNADRTLIFHGGFDSYLEELISLTLKRGLYKELTNYNFILFEGPGQGRALRSGLPLTPKWEDPVGYLIDYYNLESVDLLGMSLGGYLSLRAAAKEHRIRRVIAFDVMFNIQDALVMKYPQVLETINHLDDSKVANEFNNFLLKISKNNVDLAFKLYRGMDITMTKQPIDFVKQALEYTLEGIMDEVRSDTLLIGCTKDLYVPANVAAKEAAQLVNARSLTLKILTEKTGGERHCQAGYPEIAMQIIIEFLSSNNLMTK